MASLKFKTRGQSDPKGKRRVYFSCHSDDFSSYFNQITNEILEISNCAIYYRDPIEDVKIDEDYYLDLGQMNLIVIPVTTKYLTEESYAYDVDFKYATENHLPVLPIMEEAGLGALFAKKCGDIQYLDPYSIDVTAISYKEKLKKYLNSVLIDDWFEEVIRKEFDGSIFLSYRKKDRKHALELMRLIHKNDFCRDIAIWYDEFLVPGENYNNAIESALKKSDLVVLAVTPNVVNEKNYVMQVEYPMAIKNGKKILPVEMVPTNKIKLMLNCLKIFKPIKSENSERLRKQLDKALASVAKRENDKDPRHNYLIGLAYLHGIGVETNHNIARLLITSSAVAGYMEAMEKIADMYRNGDGVERNPAERIKWLERMSEITRKEFEKDKTRLNAEVYISKLLNLGEGFYENRDYEKANWVYERALDVSKKINDCCISPLAKYCMMASFMALGELYGSQDKLDESMEYYKRGLEIAQELTDDMEGDLPMDTDENYNQIAKDIRAFGVGRMVGYNCIKLGEACHSQGKLDDAISYNERAIEIFGRIVKESDRDEAVRALAISYGNLGDIYDTKGNLDEAKSYHKKGFNLFQRLFREMYTVESKRDFAICHTKLGGISKSQGDFDEAREHYQRGIEIFESVVKMTDLPECYEDLAITYETAARLDDNIHLLQKAFDIYDMLCNKNPGVSKYVSERNKIRVKIDEIKNS